MSVTLQKMLRNIPSKNTFVLLWSSVSAVHVTNHMNTVKSSKLRQYR